LLNFTRRRLESAKSSAGGVPSSTGSCDHVDAAIVKGVDRLTMDGPTTLKLTAR